MSELSMVSFSASSSRVIPGQEITVTCKLKNISGNSIRYWAVGIGVDGRTFGDTEGSFRQDFVYVAGGRVTQDSISWAAGKTKTFVWTVAIPETASELFSEYSKRAVPLVISFTTAYSQNYLASDTYVTDLDTVAVLDMYYTPKIDDFHLVRATDGNVDEEGASVLTTIKLSQWLGAYASPTWNPVCKLHYAPIVTGSEVTEIDLTGDIPALLEGITNIAAIVQGEISPGNDYQFILTFGDDYERAVSINEEIVEAFANFAMSETGAGASFGGFPRSTADDPMLESHYRIVPYEGVNGVNRYVAPMTVEENAGVWHDGSRICRVTVDLPAIAADKESIIDLGIPGETATRIISIDGAFDAGDGAWMSLSYSNDSGVAYQMRVAVINVGLSGSNLSLRLVTGASRTIIGGHATIAYTVVKEA